MSVILVASTGGHLAQLHQLRPRLVGKHEHVIWVCPDTDQSRSMLKGEVVRFVPYVAPRDWRNVLRNARVAWLLLRGERPTAVYSTGAGIALAFLPLAKLFRARSVYIESAARCSGPSLTGRILSAIPGVETYCQYRTWASQRWKYLVSIFDDFVAEDVPHSDQISSVVVTLGTIGYGFRSLVEEMIRLLPEGAEVTWQTGATDISELTIQAVASMPAKSLEAHIAQADVVVAHSGVGSALAALNAGKVPVLVPRRSSRGEHVDDHQQLIARELAGRGLAVYAELDELDLDHLRRAAGRRVVSSPGPDATTPPPQH